MYDSSLVIITGYYFQALARLLRIETPSLLRASLRSVSQAALDAVVGVAGGRNVQLRVHSLSQRGISGQGNGNAARNIERTWTCRWVECSRVDWGRGGGAAEEGAGT